MKCLNTLLGNLLCKYLLEIYTKRQWPTLKVVFNESDLLFSRFEHQLHPLHKHHKHCKYIDCLKLLPFKITCKKVQDGKVVENPRNVKKKAKNSKHQDFFERFDLKLISRIAIAIIVVILAIAFAIWASTTDHGVL